MSRQRLAAAVSAVEELVPPDSAEDPDSERRAELVRRYATVRPFLASLPEVVPLAAVDAGRPVLTALRGLPGLTGRRRVRRSDVVEAVVTGSWRRLVFANPELGEGKVDVRAYALCVLEALHRALRRRDVYATGSLRWGDPRARLLDGPAWAQARPGVLTALRLPDGANPHLDNLAGRLDSAYRELAGQLDAATESDPQAAVRLQPGADGRARLHLSRLAAVAEPASLVELRATVARMLPRVDLPEVLLEVDAGPAT